LWEALKLHPHTLKFLLSFLTQPAQCGLRRNALAVTSRELKTLQSSFCLRPVLPIDKSIIEAEQD